MAEIPALSVPGAFIYEIKRRSRFHVRIFFLGGAPREFHSCLIHHLRHAMAERRAPSVIAESVSPSDDLPTSAEVGRIVSSSPSGTGSPKVSASLNKTGGSSGGGRWIGIAFDFLPR
ncbi:hypothetical protein AVEN_205594-1 [Araneus ventricosus]|uniref:Uncharacterized protein n=1 Tax=Araneus ventricosus TaxID=182803 RepID=A0A4Y2FC49_ARAVE|nr:hypothetical protein AVEN_205594-1 [Araneus ventricosus]